MFEQIYARERCVCVCVLGNFCQLENYSFAHPSPSPPTLLSRVCVFLVLHLNFAFDSSVDVCTKQFAIVCKTLYCLFLHFAHFPRTLVQIVTLFSVLLLLLLLLLLLHIFQTDISLNVEQFSIIFWAIHLHSKAVKLMQTI